MGKKKNKDKKVNKINKAIIEKKQKLLPKIKKSSKETESSATTLGLNMHYASTFAFSLDNRNYDID